MAKKNKILENKKKKWSKKHKIIIFITLFVVAIIAILYGYGSYYYQKDRQITRIVATLKNPNADLSHLVQGTDPDIKITKASLKPLQNYYKQNPKQLNELTKSLRDNQYDGQIQLVENGEYFLVFPKYELRVKVYQPQVETNNANSRLTVNGKNYGTMTGAGQNYYQNLGLIFPGKYHILVNTKVAGRKLEADSVVDIWSDKTIDMLIRTATFRIRSVPNGIVYINGKKAAKLDKSGQYVFKAYPLAKNIELQVKTKSNGKTISSVPVQNLTQIISQQSSNTVEGSTDYNHKAKFLGNKNTAVYQDSDGNFIVNPFWTGLIQAKQASGILANNFAKVNADNFVNGEKNASYKKLNKEVKDLFKTYKAKKWKIQVTVTSILPLPNNRSEVKFRAVYKRKNHKIVASENYAIFQNKNNQQLIEKIAMK